MSERRVLFIVEGGRGETRFLRKMHSILFGTRPENVFVYGTVVHSLLRSVFPDGRADEYLDVVSVLRGMAGDEDRDMLEQEFSDVYLVFDMDPHDARYDARTLALAMAHFNDSTENGKLYLNYPMLESYRHLKGLEDSEYLDRTVSLADVGRYKDIVGRECADCLKDLGKYDERVFGPIIRMNLMKADRILGGPGEVPTAERFLSWDGCGILDEQLRLMDGCGRLHVLNTSVFNPVDFAPGRFCRSG